MQRPEGVDICSKEGRKAGRQAGRLLRQMCNGSLAPTVLAIPIHTWCCAASAAWHIIKTVESWSTSKDRCQKKKLGLADPATPLSFVFPVSSSSASWTALWFNWPCPAGAEHMHPPAGRGGRAAHDNGREHSWHARSKGTHAFVFNGNEWLEPCHVDGKALPLFIHLTIV